MALKINNYRDVTRQLDELSDTYFNQGWLCPNCETMLKESLKYEDGSIIRVDGDFNDCPYAADMMYGDENGNQYQYLVPDEHISDGNDRTYKIHGATVFETVDNGGGYFVIQCPYFKQRHNPLAHMYERKMGQMLKYTDALIKRGVSPDCAADNAGYILYAALGGQARQEHRTTIKIDASENDEK